jgi:hypothetical protein
MNERFRPTSIGELADFMIASGYKRSSRAPGRSLFTQEKDRETLYLAQAIDFYWLERAVELRYPLKAFPKENCVSCEATYKTIQGASAAD